LSHPVLSRLRSLEREKEQLGGMHIHEDTEQAALLEWRTKLQASVPLLKEDLVKKLEGMTGETVQFQMNGPARG
jgi:hypothetical protein